MQSPERNGRHPVQGTCDAYRGVGAPYDPRMNSTFDYQAFETLPRLFAIPSVALFLRSVMAQRPWSSYRRWRVHQSLLTVLLSIVVGWSTTLDESLGATAILEVALAGGWVLHVLYIVFKPDPSRSQKGELPEQLPLPDGVSTGPGTASHVEQSNGAALVGTASADRWDRWSLTVVAGAVLASGSVLWLLLGPEQDLGPCAPESVGAGPAALIGVIGVALLITGVGVRTRSVLWTLVVSAIVVPAFVGLALLGTLLDGFCF